MVNAAGAAGAIAMRGNLQAQRIRPQVRDLAEKFDRSFRVAAIQFAVCGTHAAERVQFAIGADGLALFGSLTNFL